MSYRAAAPLTDDSGDALHRTGLWTAARRWWWLLLVAAAAAGVMGYLVASRVPPTYEAEAQLLVGPVLADQGTLKAAGQNSQTYAALATTSNVLDAVRGEEQLGLTTSQLRSKINATANDVTRILSIKAQDGNPQVAQRLANAVALALVQYVGSNGVTAIQPQTSTDQTSTSGSPTPPPPAASQGQPESKLQTIQRATAPKKNTGLSPLLIAPGAAIAGLLGALGLVVIVESLGNGIRDEDDLGRLARADVLGSVDGIRRPRRGEPLVGAGASSRAAVAYRVLAAKIQSANGDAALRSLVVVGVEPGDGSGELSANLAAVLAASDTRVTLVDLGGRDEIQHLFSANGADGGIVGRAKLHRYGKETLANFGVQGHDGLTLALPRFGIESFDRDEARGLLESLLGETDIVVVNAPPVDRSPGSLVWTRVADGAILVAQSRRTNRNKVGPAADSLRMIRANLLGTVLRDPRGV